MIKFARTFPKISYNLGSYSSKYNFCWRKRFVDKMVERQKEEAKMWQQAKSIEEIQQQRKAEESLSEQQKQIIKAYKVDKVWNLAIRQDLNHNFQKEIIVHKKKFERSTQQLRSAILFEDLLKSQKDILIYDTKGRPFVHKVLKLLYFILSVGAALYSIQMLKNYDKKNEVLLQRTTMGKIIKYSIISMSVILLISSFLRYHNFYIRYVQKVMYNTQKQQFTLTKRNFFGKKYNYMASRYKILYTQNKALNHQGTNYFDIDTKEQFSIAYKDSWVKQDLFSHLISQRIKL